VIKLLIFDHDMTIVDSSHAILEAINLTAEAIGKPRVTRDVVLEYAAVSLPSFMTGIWGEWREDWIALYREKVEPIERVSLRPFPEVPCVLIQLRGMGLTLAVASNRYDPRAAMDKSDTSKYFDAIVGRSEGLPDKPDPAMLSHLMGRFGSEKTETLYIGDSDVDLNTARAAGVRFVGITRGNFARGRLEALGAWRVADSLNDLPSIAGEENGAGVVLKAGE
jgi:phosphoglycolate phosphatase